MNMYEKLQRAHSTLRVVNDRSDFDLEPVCKLLKEAADHIAALENAIGNYLGAIAERNSWAYPEPDERMRMAQAIDDTQATMFALLKEQGE